MKHAVVDTSALVRLYVPDGPMPEGLEQAVEDAWRGDLVLAAPELLLAEVGQVLLKKERAGFVTRGDVDEILRCVAELPLELVGHAALLNDACALARSSLLSVYDGLFLALARRQRAPLLTCDEKLARARDALG